LALGQRVNARPELALVWEEALILMGEALEADAAGLSEITPDGQDLAFKFLDVPTRQPAIHHPIRPLRLDPATSMAAHCLRLATTVSCPYLLTEERFNDAVLLALGLVSGIAVPLTVAGRPWGTLGVYYKQPHEFHPDDVQFVEALSQMAGACAAQASAEHELTRQQRCTQGLLDLLDNMVLMLDAQGQVLNINRAGEAVTGFTGEELCGQTVVDALASPETLTQLEEFLAAAALQPGPRELQGSLLTKDHSRRQVLWTAQAVTDKQGQHIATLLQGTCPEQEGTSAGPLIVAEPAGTPQNRQPSGRERRSSQRCTFEYRQFMAPVLNGELPRRPDFFEVGCRDISSGGIALVLTAPPDSDRAVIALGRDENRIYVMAQVRRVAQESNDRETRYIVGYRFTGRIDIEPPEAGVASTE